ncbi:MAG TPA: DUF2071 domain-containing protein, partial [Phycisphaerales bacterium]|nr:DUF2071 domain-containing protein [Phycisphaerales bacterium]
AENWPAVRVARRLFRLPYMDARMSLRWKDGRVEYESVRTHRGEPPAEFRGSYRPTGPAANASPGTLAYFLAERYCLYACGWRGDTRLFRCDIHHRLWPLREAEAEVPVNSMATAAGVTVPARSPHLMFAERLDVAAWWPERVRD